MPKGFIREQIFSMKIDPKRWLILETKGFHDWNLRVVGPEPENARLFGESCDPRNSSTYPTFLATATGLD